PPRRVRALGSNPDLCPGLYRVRGSVRAAGRHWVGPVGPGRTCQRFVSRKPSPLHYPPVQGRRKALGSSEPTPAERQLPPTAPAIWAAWSAADQGLVARECSAAEAG